MSQRELKSLLSTLLPYVNGKKQGIALFTVVLFLGLSHGAFDAPHLHAEPAPMEPTVAVMLAASGTNINMSQTQPIYITVGP
jgi:hypothetical protein